MGRASHPLDALPAFVGIGALVAADYLGFRHFHRNYFHWYVTQGTLVSVTLSALVVGLELDQYPALISTNARDYAAGWVEKPGFLFLSFSDVIGSNTVPAIDGILTGLIGLALAPLWISWLIVVAPVQYFVILLTGAPARSALASGRKTLIGRQESFTEIRSAPASEDAQEAQEITLARHPVSATNAITAAVLFAASQFL
jgi:hypothetical protein